MDLENLKSDMVVKNYKDMCLILGEEECGGKQRTLQIKEWERHFDFERKGHKYIIKEIYPVPLPKDFSSNDVYSKYVQVILTKYLKEEGCGDFTMGSLLKVCGFVNNNWEDTNLLADYAKDNGISYSQARYYYNQLYQHVYTYCTNAVTRCLNRLSQRGFLRWNKVLYIKDENGTREATKEETKTYLNDTCEIRRKLGIKYLNVYNRDEYYKEVSKKIEEYGWENAYNMIQIIYATNFIDDIIEESQKEYYESLYSVNSHCLEQMHKYVETDIEKDVKKLADKLGEEDLTIAMLCMDVDSMRKKKTEITDMFIEIERKKDKDK